MISGPSAIEILSRLGIVVLELKKGGLELVGEPPEWFLGFCPEAKPGKRHLGLRRLFPLLENFLFDAEQFWMSEQQGRLQSGSWLQTDAAGKDWAMEASAVRAGKRKILLIEALGESFEERRAALQAARDKGLALEKLGRHARSLSERNREVERLNQLKNEFLASMSHELRTPLNAIIGFSTLLAEGHPGPLNEKQRTFLNHVTRAGDHLLSLINDILDLSKIEAGCQELRPETFGLSEAAEEVLATTNPLARAKQIRINIRLGAHLVYADRTRFKQVIYNLLINAIRFTPESGTITIESKLVGDDLAISVTDTGVGVEPAEREAIFDKFYQAGKANNTGSEGTGLGLAISKRLVEMQGGRIWVESPSAGGSRFVFTVPCEGLTKSSESERRPGTDQDLDETSPRFEPLHPELHVAIVDDDSAGAALLFAMLETRFRLTVHHTGQQALDSFRRNPPELVLLDISLPDLDGTEVLRRMRTDTILQNVPAIAISAHAMEGDRERFLTAGFDDYLQKPVTDRAALVARIQTLISRDL